MDNEFIGDEVYRHPTLPLRIAKNSRDPPNGYVGLVGNYQFFIPDRTLSDLTAPHVTPDEMIEIMDRMGTIRPILKRSSVSPELLQIALLHTSLREEREFSRYLSSNK